MFPERTKWLKRPVGWKDLGKVRKKDILKDGEIYTETKLCTFCRGRIRVAKDNGSIFWFCPKCEIKFATKAISKLERRGRPKGSKNKK